MTKDSNNSKESANNRVVSGMRASGRLHLGNYHGALKNWLQLQHKYDCYFFVADWHGLTTHYDRTEGLAASTWAMLQDWLAAGLDPKQCKIFVQSGVKEHAELHLLLSMITPVSWLERVPTYKDQQEKLTGHDLATYGFLGYPALQSADVLLYQAGLVPVGEDQVAHIELTREIARRFNFLYGQKSILPEPKPLLTNVAKFPGLDGQKMSKSYNNTIGLTEDPKIITKKIKTMPTDPARIKRTDPGDPAKCPVWPLHQVYSNTELKKWVQQGCTTAGIGCLDCKKTVIDAIIKEQQPILVRAQEYADLSKVKRIVKQGVEQARAVAQTTMEKVREVIGLVDL